MWRGLIAAVLTVVVAACAQIPPSPADIEAKRFTPVAGKAVIYIVREPMDSDQTAGLMLDDSISFGTLPGTYYRYVVAPGMHKIEGTGAAGGRVTLNAQAGQIYYVMQSVYGTDRTGMAGASLQQVSAAQGRSMVTGSTLSQ